MNTEIKPYAETPEELIRAIIFSMIITGIIFLIVMSI